MRDSDFQSASPVTIVSVYRVYSVQMDLETFC